MIGLLVGLILASIILLIKTQAIIVTEYRTLLNGKVIVGNRLSSPPHKKFYDRDKVRLSEKLHKADSLYKLTGNSNANYDLGTMYLYTGQYLDAKKIFQRITLKSSGIYQTEGNLATAYELLGQNDSALYWVKKACEIDSNAYNDSEWIHIKILEAKMKANGNEQYLWDNSILSLDFGNDVIPVNKNNIDLERLEKQLYYQLEERMSHYSPKDPVVAQLLFDLGNVCAITTEVKKGLDVLEVAKEYGYKSELLDQRLAYFNQLQSKAYFYNLQLEIRRRLGTNIRIFFLLFVGIFIVSLLIMIYLFNRLIKKWKKKV